VCCLIFSHKLKYCSKSLSLAPRLLIQTYINLYLEVSTTNDIFVEDFATLDYPGQGFTTDAVEQMSAKLGKLFTPMSTPLLHL